MTIQIVEIKQENVIEGNYVHLVVRYQIIGEKGEVLAERNEGFPIEMTADEIKASLKKALETYQSDLAIGAASERSEALSKQAEETAKKLTGQVIA